MASWCRRRSLGWCVCRVRVALTPQHFNDFQSNPSAPAYASVDQSWAELPRLKAQANKDIEKAFVAASKDAYKAKVWPSTQTQRRLGNAYTASIFCALASLIDSVEPAALQGKRVAMYAYGSGLAASFYSIRVRGDVSNIRSTVDLRARLAATEVRPCDEYVSSLALREHVHNISDWTPSGSLDYIAPGTYYLERCDAKYRRSYGLKA